MNSLCSPLGTRYIYISMLKFFDLFISEFFFSSMFDAFKDIDVKTFPKSIKNDIRPVITTLYSMSTILTFF